MALAPKYPRTLAAIQRLPVNKYRFSRAHWYRAQLPSLDPVWHLSNDYNAIIGWCTQHFGPHPGRPDAWSRWWVGTDHINFRESVDYNWYVLRWGA